MSSELKPYFPVIDGLRAIAVLAVILFHLEFELFQGGFVGVDIFFVISGYLITRNIMVDIANMRFSFSTFYLARLRRLAPALIVTIAVTLLFGFLLYSPDALSRLSASSIAGVLSLANIRYWMVSGYFDVGASSKPLLHLWSLSVEEQFYLIWPLLLVILARIFLNKRFVFIAIIAVCVTSFCFAQYTVVRDPDMAFYWVQYRVYEFGVGALLAYYELNFSAKVNTSMRLQNFIGLAGLMCVVLAVLVFDEFTPVPGYWFLLPCLGTVMLIWSKNASALRLLMANRAAQAVGKISYSLYLVHWPIWVFASFWYFTAFTFVQKIGVFVGIFVAAICLYSLVEKKYRYGKAVNILANSEQAPETLTKQSNSLFVIGFAVLVLIILSFAWYIRSNNGLPNRLTAYSNLPTSNRSIECTYPRNNKQFQNCIFGEKVAPMTRVLLVGDSHSTNIRSGFDQFGVENKIQFHSYSATGCAPLLNIKLMTESAVSPDKQCLSYSHKLQELVSSEKFDSIIFVARWMWYYEHEPYGFGQDVIKGYIFDGDGDIVKGRNSELSRRTWVKALTNTIEFAESHDKKVIIFSQFPLLNKGIGECDKSPSYLINPKNNDVRCAVRIPYEGVMQRLSFTNSFINGLASTTVLPILPSNHLCDSARKQCNILTDQGLLYSDDNHLSALGSQHLIESISDQLSDFILSGH